MPHLILEYSSNLDDVVDVQGLCQSLHQALMASGLFELGAPRVRAFAASRFAVADLDSRNAFLDMVLRIGAGRTRDDAKQVGDLIFLAASKHLVDVLAAPYFALSLEIREIDPELSWKANTIHPRLRASS